MSAFWFSLASFQTMRNLLESLSPKTTAGAIWLDDVIVTGKLLPDSWPCGSTNWPKMSMLERLVSVFLASSQTTTYLWFTLSYAAFGADWSYCSSVSFILLPYGSPFWRSTNRSEEHTSELQ